jgi:hypothetical protein
MPVLTGFALAARKISVPYTINPTPRARTIQEADTPRKLAMALENSKQATPLRKENTLLLNNVFLSKDELFANMRVSF